MTGNDVLELAMIMFFMGLCGGLFFWPYLMHFK